MIDLSSALLLGASCAAGLIALALRAPTAEAPAPPELALGVDFSDPDAYLEQERTVGEADVMAVARAWSVDPNSFGGPSHPVGLGTLGGLPR